MQRSAKSHGRGTHISTWLGPLTVALVLAACLPAFLACRPYSLSQRYPGDVGIESNAAVIFFEDFDGASPQQVAGRWTSAQPERAALVPGIEGAGDANALEMTVIGGQYTGATFFKRLPDSYDRLHVRYYVRYHPGTYNHNGVIVGGYNPASDFALGTCCTAPDGDRAFVVHLELIEDQFGQHFFPGPNHMFGFYTYWMEMTSWGEGSVDCADPMTGEIKPCAAGNRLMNGANPRIPFGEWIAVEVAIEMNDPAERDGTLEMWIDGQPVTQDGQVVSRLGPGFPNGDVSTGFFTPDASSPDAFPGFRWRDDPALALNFVWLNHYSSHLGPGEQARIEYDQLVVATEYIGPMATGDPIDPPPPPPPPPGFSLVAQAQVEPSGVVATSSVSGGVGPYQYLFDCGDDQSWDGIVNTGSTTAQHTCPSGTALLRAWVWDQGSNETRESVFTPQP